MDLEESDSSVASQEYLDQLRYGKDRVQRCQAAAGKSEYPAHVVLGDTLFTRWGEPLKVGAMVKWIDAETIKEGRLINFCLWYSPENYSVIVLAIIKTESAANFVLKDATFKHLLGGAREMDYFGRRMAWAAAERKRMDAVKLSNKKASRGG